MKKLWKSLCLAVFITGVMAFSQTQIKTANQIEEAVPYTVITVEYQVNSDGVKKVLGERIRYVNAKGEWRQTRHDPVNAPSRPSPVIASTDEGVFLKAPDSPGSKFVSPPANQRMQECFRSPHCLRNQLSFVRMEEVAGLQVYVLRTEVADPAHPLAWIEDSYSPKTGYIPLRSVQHFRDGSEMVTEATKVEFTSVPENMNDDVKASPKK